MKYVECDGVFKPFELAPDVCDTCGRDAESHAEKNVDMLPYKEAIWKVLLEQGGTHDFYGGYGYDSKSLKKHFKECGVNFSKMRTPEMGTVGEFGGTGHDADQVPVVQGTAYCNCEHPPVYKEWMLKYNDAGVEWILRDANLSQLIWQVVKAGEIKG